MAAIQGQHPARVRSCATRWAGPTGAVRTRVDPDDAPVAGPGPTKHAGASSETHTGASGDRRTAGSSCLPPGVTDRRPEGVRPGW